MIKSSSVSENRFRDKRGRYSSTSIVKSAVNKPFFGHFHYVHLTTCVQLEEISLLRISPAKYKMSVQNVHLLLHIVSACF